MVVSKSCTVFMYRKMAGLEDQGLGFKLSSGEKLKCLNFTGAGVGKRSSENSPPVRNF